MTGDLSSSNDDLPPEGQRSDVVASMLALAGLSVAELGFHEVLSTIADLAVKAIPGADGAGLTVLENDRADTVVASADFVREVDALQYGIGEGPCITAVAERRTVRSGFLAGDAAFPRFGPRASHLGVHSVLSLPLLTSTAVLGSLNVYARRRDAFDNRSVELGQLFARPAQISVQNTQALSEARAAAANLQSALVNRGVIDQAIGIMISRTGASPDEAFDRLRLTSQTENRKLSIVAAQLVDEAMRRARARHNA